jgi:hypothetical protein
MICYMFLYSFLIRTKMLPEKVKFETFKNIEFCRNQMETATLPYIMFCVLCVLYVGVSVWGKLVRGKKNSVVWYGFSVEICVQKVI